MAKETTLSIALTDELELRQPGFACVGGPGRIRDGQAGDQCKNHRGRRFEFDQRTFLQSIWIGRLLDARLLFPDHDDMRSGNTDHSTELDVVVFQTGNSLT